MSKIYLNDETSINLDKLIDTRLLVQANSGGGKSWLLRRILEQSHGKVQQIIIDLEGEFSTLREQYDYILASKEGDTAADPRSAALLAKRLLELNVSAIIDLYELSHQDRKRFVRLFLTAMVNAPKTLWHPVLVVIDEAHVFAPQTGQSEAMEAVIDLATRGRKRGYSALLATQRISKLHKDAVAEMNNKLIGRTGLDIDRKRAAEELGFTTKEDSLSLRNLAPGEFFAFGPAISEEVIKIQVGDIQTSHPKAGARILTRTTPPTDKIKAILGKLADLPQEARAEAENLEHLKSSNMELARKVRMLEKAQDKVQAPLVKQEIRVVSQPEHLEALNKIAAIANKILQVQPETIQTVHNDAITEKKITGGAQRIMQVLGARYPMTFTKSQLALLSNMSPKSGTYGTYLSLLKTQGLIDGINEISLTEKGVEYIGNINTEPQTQEQVIEMWRNNLTGGAKRMFNVLVDRYPEAISKSELGEQTDMSYVSGTFGTYLSQLRRVGVIETNGADIKASTNLFFEGVK